MVLGLANQLAVAFLAIAVISAGNLILDVTRTTIFQRVVPDAYRGRLGGVMMTVADRLRVRAARSSSRSS